MSGTRVGYPVDRFLGPEPAHKAVTLRLYQTIAHLPLVCPHGHVDPRLFVNSETVFGNPAELFIIPDHYILRMLYSQGIPLEELGIVRDGSKAVNVDPRQIWQLFASHFYLFRGTPTGIWLVHELHDLFGVTDKLNRETAAAIYDQIEAQLALPAFRPRALFAKFNIEVLCTTDAATDPLDSHRMLRDSDWAGRVLPTFRPDSVIDITSGGWRRQIDALSEVSNIDVVDYGSFIDALENRRAFFKEMGATATDQAAITAATESLTSSDAELIFQRALQGEATAADRQQFTAHMLGEMARMSVEDGLVMQLHVGSHRNYNPQLYATYGADMGADIPVSTDFTRGLRPLLSRFGNDSRFSLLLFTLDESTYSRELAPLAGHFPSVKIGPPWWFHDSWNGIRRYFDRIIETAGIYNTVGFNDDTRAFPSIPARHDVWRRAVANWLGDLVVRHMIDEEDAAEMATDLAIRLAKRAYKLD